MANKALGEQFHNQVIPQFVALRKKLGISQLEMDEILGVAKGLVSKMGMWYKKTKWLVVLLLGRSTQCRNCNKN